MSDSYPTPREEESSLELNNFQKDIDKFNDAIDVKVKYINEGKIRDLSTKKSLSDLFFHRFPTLSKSDFYHYLYHADGAHPNHNLARLLVLQDIGASRDLMSQTAENECKYQDIYVLLVNGLNEDEINRLFQQHDSPHEINRDKLYNDLHTLLREKDIIQNLNKQDVNNTPLTKNPFSKRETKAPDTPSAEKSASLLDNNKIADGQETEVSNKKTKIEIIDKNKEIAQNVESYDISRKLARLIYNNKIDRHNSIRILRELESKNVGYDLLKGIVRRKFDSSMISYSKEITDFYLERYTYNNTIENNKVNNRLTGSLIIDCDYILSGMPSELRAKIIKGFASEKDKFDFHPHAVELVTLFKDGVSTKLLYSVANGEITASDAYLIHVFKVNKKDITTLSHKLRNNELSSKDIFEYARDVRSDGNLQPKINSEPKSGSHDKLSTKPEAEPLYTELKPKALDESVSNSVLNSDDIPVKLSSSQNTQLDENAILINSDLNQSKGKTHPEKSSELLQTKKWLKLSEGAIYAMTDILSILPEDSELQATTYSPKATNAGLALTHILAVEAMTQIY
jgi:hypothetical protein